MSGLTCGCNIDYEGQRCALHAAAQTPSRILGPSIEDSMKCQMCRHLKHDGRRCDDCLHESPASQSAHEASS